MRYKREEKANIKGRRRRRRHREREEKKGKGRWEGERVRKYNGNGCDRYKTIQTVIEIICYIIATLFLPT